MSNHQPGAKNAARVVLTRRVAWHVLGFAALTLALAYLLAFMQAVFYIAVG